MPPTSNFLPISSYRGCGCSPGRVVCNSRLQMLFYCPVHTLQLCKILLRPVGGLPITAPITFLLQLTPATIRRWAPITGRILRKALWKRAASPSGVVDLTIVSWTYLWCVYIMIVLVYKKWCQKYTREKFRNNFVNGLVSNKIYKILYCLQQSIYFTTLFDSVS